MAVRTREEILNAINTHFGDDNSDDTLTLLGDLADTITELENKANNSQDWKKQYEENDAAWRKKYRDRFFTDSSDVDDSIEEPPGRKTYSYDNLFKEG